MCGIAGVFYFNNNSNIIKLDDQLVALLNNISHRGPDDNGVLNHNHCAIGTVRLSIIDIPTGHQPMQSSDGRYSIVFNGEIYNYQSVKDMLIDENVLFKTSSDTEVILNGYIKYGKDILDFLDGMFAFSIYDSKEHQLFIARDRLGKKPLYFYRDNEKLIFCSEVQAIAKLDSLPLSLNKQSYWDYLTYRYIPGLETSYNQIKEFARGQYNVVSSGGICTSTYWKIPNAINNKKSNSRFGDLFADSVKKRLVSDVPVGVMLSGGIDSCAVLYEASKHQKIDSYHVFFDTTDKDYNELEYAKQMAASVGSSLHIVEASREDFYDQLINISDITDEPLADFAAIPFKMVCDLAAKDVKVALSGEGSDEILAGYGIGSVPKRLKLLSILSNIPKPIRKLLRKMVENRVKRKITLFDEAEAGVDNWAKDTNYNITYQINQEQKLSLLNKDNDSIFLDSSRFLQDYYNQISDEDVINQMLHIISSDWLEQDVLMKSDKVSMSSSLELRCPFLDHHLVEYLFNLPGECKVGGLNRPYESKVLLKEYLHGKIPNELIFRKKLGFPVPTYDVKDKKDLDFMYDILSSDNCFYQNYFYKDKVIEMLKTIRSNISGSHAMKNFLWSIVVYELWLRGKNKTGEKYYEY